LPELVWDGKYSADGSKTRPVRVALPFQDVETVNESAQERAQAQRLMIVEKVKAPRCLAVSRGEETLPSGGLFTQLPGTEILGSSYTTLRISDSKSSRISSKRLLHDAYKACIKLLRA
jgi:hypothetical protein